MLEVDALDGLCARVSGKLNTMTSTYSNKYIPREIAALRVKRATRYFQAFSN